MIVRSAVLEGTIEGADRERFAHHMRQVVLPAIAQYPRIKDVRLRETVELDPEAPLVRFVFDLYFDSLEDMRFALASETRQRVRGTLGEFMSLLKGRVYHIVSSEIAH